MRTPSPDAPRPMRPDRRSGGRAPILTIAVPVYNVAAYVVECLESLAVLDVPADLGPLDGPLIEVVIVDDRSTDRSMALVEAAILAIPPSMAVRIIRHDRNRGLAEARNTAVAEARGEFLWFVDADDRVEPVMLRHLWEAVAPDVDVVMTDVRMVAEDGVSGSRTRLRYSRDQRWTGRQALAALYRRRIPAFMWNKLFRLTVLRGIVFPPGLIYEDLAVIGPILLRSRTVRLVASADYVYRLRPGAITAGLRPDIGDLITNVHRGVRETTRLAADVVPRDVLEDFLLREAYLPVLHAVARASGDAALRTVVHAETRSHLSYRAALRSAVHGRLPAAAAQLLARTSPTAYGGLYRCLSGAARS